jgi:putative NADPH-quinone reductase
LSAAAQLGEAQVTHKQCVIVTTTGVPANVFTNNRSYFSSGGNNTTAGMFSGMGAKYTTVQSAPNY